MDKIKKILISSFLLAICIILGRLLSIRTPIVSIGFSFVPLILVSILLGYKYGALVGMLSDLIGALLFPIGAYFPGFTLSGLLTGGIYGLILYKKGMFKVDKRLILKLILSVVLVTLFVDGILNTIWVIMITKNAANIIIPLRIVKQLIMTPIIITTMIFLLKALEPVINKFKKNTND